MLYRKNDGQGFTIVELLVVITVSTILMGIFANFFISSYQGYLNLHENALRSNEISSAIQRVTKVIRGSTSISEATDNNLTIYAYFTPKDATLSKVRYHHDQSTNSLMVDVTPASGSPPNYTYDDSNKQTFTVVGNLANNSPIFSYLDNSWVAKQFDETDLSDIKGVKVHLSSNQLGDNRTPITVDSSVSLRNRKTNL